MLEAWPRIYAALNGSATLSVLYGLSPAVQKSVLQDSSILDAGAWIAKMQGLLTQPGVRYLGMVNHTLLAAEYADAGFILYPTSFPETGCFALMKVGAEECYRMFV